MLRRVLGVCALVAGVAALAMALFFLLAVMYHVYVAVPSGTAMRSVHFRTALSPDEAYRVCYGARI